MKRAATVYIGRKGKGLRVIWRGVAEGSSLHNVYDRLRERFPDASKIDLAPLDVSKGQESLEMLDKLYGAPPGWPDDSETPTEPPESAPPARHPLLVATPLPEKRQRPAKGPQKRRNG